MANATQTADKSKLDARKCRTPEFRLSFPHLFKPHSGFENQAPKYSLTMLFPKTADLTEMRKAVLAAAIEKFGPKEKWPTKIVDGKKVSALRMPFRDGDLEKPDQKEYSKMIFVQASSQKQRPGVVDQRLQPVTEEDNSVYAGCYCRATLIAFGYDKAGNKGVSFSLQNVQKLRDGEAFSGRKKAEDDFDAVETGEDNPDNYSNGAEEFDDGL